MSDYDDDFESDMSPTKSERSSRHSLPPSSHRSSHRSAPVVKAAPAVAAVPPQRTASAPRAQKQAPGATSSAAEKPQQQRSASSLGRRILSEPSALIPLTNEEQSEMDELRRINLGLRAELLELNRQLDEQLGRKGQKVSRVHSVPKGSSMLPSDKLAQRNEQQRRINAELREQVQRPHMQMMIEVANGVGHQQKLLEEAIGEMRGLENVLHHQNQQLERIAIVEREMSNARSEQNDELREWKEQCRGFKEAREHDMATYNKLMRQVERLEEKLRVQDEVGAAVRSVAEVTEQVNERERMIDALKYQVAVLSKTNGSDKKRAQALNDRVSRELHSLREEAESLRKQVKALGMAGELGVDTRM